MKHEAATPPQTTAQAQNGQISHYAWLSLLRAYGVILVLVYHFFPWLMPGGFIGVDVFFVFSGYLITSLLIKEFRKQGKVKLVAFYTRRFRRLFPALFIMVLFTLALSLTISADFRADIARQAAAALSWTTNFYEIAGGHSYADALLPHLFVHTWTLSIEMQYYLVWGLLLTILLPLCITTSSEGRRSIVRSRRVVALIAAVLALVSYIVMQIMLIGAEDPSAAYYSTFSHAFPLLIGSVAGALAGFGRTSLVRIFEQLKPVVGIAVTAASLLLITALAILLPFDNRLVYSVGLMLTSLLVALIILVGRGAQTALHTFKEPRILQYLADRSYSIYLFHWPIMIVVLEWARSIFGQVQEGPNAPYIVAAVVGLIVTFVVSHLAYKFVEKPFSSRRVPELKKESLDDEDAPQKPRGRHTAPAGTATGNIPELRATAAIISADKASTGRLTAVRTSLDSPGTETSSTERSSRGRHAADRSSSGRSSTGRDLSGRSSTGRDSSGKNTVPRPASKVPALVAGALIIVGISVFSLVSAPSKTSIESDYQMGLLEIDRHQMESSHEALVRTGLGGSMSGEPGLLVKPGTVTVIGDSVTIFPAEGITAQTGAYVDAEVSRAMVNGIDIVAHYQNSRMLGEYVVIALATNAHGNSFESAIAICDMLEPGHRLIFVTAYGTPSMDDLSAALRTLPQSYPFVTIADWNAVIAGQDHLLAADGYHLAGQEATDIYVDVVVRAIEEAAHKPTS